MTLTTGGSVTNPISPLTITDSYNAYAYFPSKVLNVTVGQSATEQLTTSCTHNLPVSDSDVTLDATTSILTVTGTTYGSKFVKIDSGAKKTAIHAQIKLPDWLSPQDSSKVNMFVDQPNDITLTFNISGGFSSTSITCCQLTEVSTPSIDISWITSSYGPTDGTVILTGSPVAAQLDITYNLDISLIASGASGSDTALSL